MGDTCIRTRTHIVQFALMGRPHIYTYSQGMANHLIHLCSIMPGRGPLLITLASDCQHIPVNMGRLQQQDSRQTFNTNTNDVLIHVNFCTKYKLARGIGVPDSEVS